MSAQAKTKKLTEKGQKGAKRGLNNAGKGLNGAGKGLDEAGKGLNKKNIQRTNLLTEEPETGAEEREVVLGGGAVVTEGEMATAEGESGIEEETDEIETDEIETAEADEVEPVPAEEMKTEELEPELKGKVIEEKRGRWWHRLNVSYPWLKFVLFMLVAVGMLFGGYGMARMMHETGTNGGEVVGEIEGDEPEKVASEGEPKEEVKGEEKPAPEDEMAENGGQSGSEENVVAPPVTVAPPVSVPEGATGKKLIALTFDDGPSGVTTPRLLDILRDKGVKVTFFMLGQRMQQVPDIVRRAEAEGHEVASHTPYHNQQTKLSAANIQAEAATMNQIFTEILGHTPPMTRPPYGSVNDTVRQYLGQPLILWSIDPEDWKDRNAATVRARVVGAAHDGAIALMHDIHATTVDAVAGIIDDLRAQGYEFLTVSELAAARGVPLQSGWTYYNFRP